MAVNGRRKGRAAESEAKNLLLDRDFIVDDLTCGIKSEDFIAEDTDGKRYSVEVKNHKSINLEKFIKQAVVQGNHRKLPWLLMVRLHGGGWLVKEKGGRWKIW
jgi:hypothetical protein